MPQAPAIGLRKVAGITHIADILDIVRYRWRLVVACCAVFAILALAYVALVPRTYSATASLLLDTGAPDPMSEAGATEGPSDNRTIVATQADLVRSPRVAGQAAIVSGLAKDPRYVERWREDVGDKQSYDDWITEEMSEALTVAPGRDTNVLLITAKARTSRDAAAIANGFARASVESQYRLRTEPAKAYAVWLENRLTSARTDVVTAQKRLSQFVKKSGLTSEDLSSEGNQMSDVATQLAAAEARAAAARQPDFAGAQGRGDAEKSETIQRLRAQVAERNAKLSELGAVFGPEHPDVKRTRAEVATLESRLASEVAGAASTFSAARGAEAAAGRAAASASEARLRGLAAEQRSRMLRMGTSLAEHQRLRNEFEDAQRTFNDLSQRLNRMRLQAAVPLASVQVLDTAAAPLVPSNPNVPLTMALAIVLGAIIGALAAIWLEWRDPRVRSRGGLVRMLGVPVVGVIALPRPPQRRLAGGFGLLRLAGPRA